MCKAAALREDCLWGGLARGQNHSFPLRPLKQMPIKYLFLVNKQGQTRISKYYDAVPLENRVALEADIIRKCLGRNDSQCHFLEYQLHKVVYRRYASLYFIIGIDNEENELAISEIIHFVVETMDAYFGTVCELDIMFNFDKVHFLIDEVIANGCIVEGSSRNVLAPLTLLDQHTTKEAQM